MNHYERLGAKQDADFDGLKKAYYRRVKECHPDLFNNSPSKTEEFKLLVAAFDTLSDPDKRRSYDESLGIGRERGEEERSSAPAAMSAYSIMDSDVDDTLEELIVGNALPLGATLATLFLDLERTHVFMSYREGRNRFSERRYREAVQIFHKVVCLSPDNILHRVYFARCLAFCGELAKAKAQYKAALAIGKRRSPPQALPTVQRELDAVCRMQMPWWHGVTRFLFPKSHRRQISVEDEMIEQTNRAMDKLARERKGERKRLN